MDSSIRASTTNSAVPSVRPRARRLRRMLSRPRAAVGIGLSTLLVALALLAPIVAPHDPLSQARGDELASPSLRFPFGTDELGRDILSRVLFGARISLMVALLSVLICQPAGAIVSSSYLHQAPWYGLYPGVFLTVLILGLNFISEGVQEVYSPRA